MEYQEEVNSGAATAMAVDETGAAVDATTETTDGTAGGFIVTESYVVPPATPKKHRGTITGVTALVTKTGSTAILVTAHSDDNGRDYEQKIWPPIEWIENPRLTQDTKFVVNGQEVKFRDLPIREGKKQTPAQRFGSAISNSKGTGDVDRLLQVAKTAGRTAQAAYTTFTDFIEQFNTLLAGTPVIFTTKEGKNDDPQYQAREEVNGFYGYDFDLDKLKSYQSASGN